MENCPLFLIKTKSSIFTLAAGKFKTKVEPQYSNDVGLYDLSIYFSVLYSGWTPTILNFYFSYSLCIIVVLEHILYIFMLQEALNIFKMR